MRRAQTECFIPGSTSDFGQSKLDTPDLSLVSQTVFADDFQLGIAVVMLDGPQT
jgi:hypothetical protein